MKQPKISIIIPIYNTGASVKTLLKSLEHDPYKNLEIILINDGSTDDTEKILNPLAQNNPKITLITQKNSGPSAARNRGLEKATGDYIVFLDSDDEISPDFLTTLKTLIERPNTSLALTALRRKNLETGNDEILYRSPLPQKPETEPEKTYILKLLLKDGRLYPVINKIFKSAPIKKHHLKFDESLNFAEDLKFVLAYLDKQPGEIRFTEKPLYTYNYKTKTSTVNTSAKSWQNWQKSYTDLKSWLDPNPTTTQKLLLKLLKLRWHISHAKNVLK